MIWKLPKRNQLAHCFFVLLLTTVFFDGCTSLPKKEDVVIPTTVESLFATCLSGDGAINIQFFNESGLVNSGDMEWVATYGEGWKSQLIDPLGAVLLRFSYSEKAKTFSSGGPLMGIVPKITDEDGFIHVDDYFVGLRPNEIPCFLKFQLPRDWLANVYNFKEVGDQLHVTFADKKRVIETVITGRQPAHTSKICSTISWRVFLGITSRELTVCSSLAKPKNGSITGGENLTLKWVDLDG